MSTFTKPVSKRITERLPELMVYGQTLRQYEPRVSFENQRLVLYVSNSTRKLLVSILMAAGLALLAFMVASLLGWFSDTRSTMFTVGYVSVFTAGWLPWFYLYLMPTFKGSYFANISFNLAEKECYYRQSVSQNKTRKLHVANILKTSKIDFINFITLDRHYAYYAVLTPAYTEKIKDKALYTALPTVGGQKAVRLFVVYGLLWHDEALRAEFKAVTLLLEEWILMHRADLEADSKSIPSDDEETQSR